jgi:predicted TIM-barrel fold metal-dependent hydrolase
MIDFHVHMGRIYRHGYPAGIGLTVHQLIDWMDRNGVDIGVLLPLESPEGAPGYFTTEEAVEARDTYPQRLIAFMCVDPRMACVEQLMDSWMRRFGVSGFGEHINELPFDDRRNKVIYRKCDEYGLPLVFDMNASFLTDEVGLPRFESCLREFPNIKWVGHGPAFWSAISADDPRGGYPPEPIVPGGALDRLFAEYENLYADLSAGSGYNAMTRDPDFTLGFLQRHWQRLMFGTDVVFHTHHIPQFEWFGTLDIPADMRTAIAEGNARRVLGLTE